MINLFHTTAAKKSVTISLGVGDSNFLGIKNHFKITLKLNKTIDQFLRQHTAFSSSYTSMSSPFSLSAFRPGL